jgi:hypothetical protein
VIKKNTFENSNIWNTSKIKLHSITRLIFTYLNKTDFLEKNGFDYCKRYTAGTELLLKK